MTNAVLSTALRQVLAVAGDEVLWFSSNLDTDMDVIE